MQIIVKVDPLLYYSALVFTVKKITIHSLLQSCISMFLFRNLSGEKAVECLMASKWTKEPKDRQDSLTPWFKTRTNAVDYCIQWVWWSSVCESCTLICTHIQHNSELHALYMYMYMCVPAISIHMHTYTCSTWRGSDHPFHTECLLLWGMYSTSTLMCVCMYL